MPAEITFSNRSPFNVRQLGGVSIGNRRPRLYGAPVIVSPAT
jgi:hypothetical protein